VQILWGSLTASTLIYALLAWFIRGAERSGVRPSLPPTVVEFAPIIALALGAVCLAMAWFLGTVVGPATSLAPGAGDDPAAAEQRRWGKITTATTLMGAIAETVAILGLVLAFLGLPFDRFLYFAVASLILHGVIFFRIQGWIAAAR
jgi:hypothetical protein